ncbi:hypothetical protein E2C01_056073 [Portunus trituberculatus]|uniref:Uncharacterized protein n=1 Tax=Portunus trituberculatus TaxID=210409 RepID=A0A5B7GZD1_PORTR|nr:hypothetical protein [Portunus trituberculatus]
MRASVVQALTKLRAGDIGALDGTLLFREAGRQGNNARTQKILNLEEEDEKEEEEEEEEEMGKGCGFLKGRKKISRFSG